MARRPRDSLPPNHPQQPGFGGRLGGPIRQEGLEDREAGARALDILLRGAPADADGADHQTFAQARDAATEDDVPSPAVGLQPPQFASGLGRCRSLAVSIR